MDTARIEPVARVSSASLSTPVRSVGPASAAPKAPGEAGERDGSAVAGAVGVVVTLGSGPSPRAPQYQQNGRLKEEGPAPIEGAQAPRAASPSRDQEVGVSHSSHAHARHAAAPGGIDGPTVVDGAVVAGKGDVVVDVLSSTAAYNNLIYWSTDNFRTRRALPVDGDRSSVNLGSFAPGTRIEFGVLGADGQLLRADASEGASGEAAKGPGHVHRPGESLGG